MILFAIVGVTAGLGQVTSDSLDPATTREILENVSSVSMKPYLPVEGCSYLCMANGFTVFPGSNLYQNPFWAAYGLLLSGNFSSIEEYSMLATTMAEYSSRAFCFGSGLSQIQNAETCTKAANALGYTTTETATETSIPHCTLTDKGLLVSDETGKINLTETLDTIFRSGSKTVFCNCKACEPIPYPPPKSIPGCSAECTNGYFSAPAAQVSNSQVIMDIQSDIGQRDINNNIAALLASRLARLFCDGEGQTQIATAAECQLAAVALGLSPVLVEEMPLPFCGYDDATNTLYVSDDIGSTSFITTTAAFVQFMSLSDVLVLCKCQSCVGDTSTIMSSDWWTAAGVGLGLTAAGGSIAASRAS